MGTVYRIDRFPWGRPAGAPEGCAEITFYEDALTVLLSSREENPRCTVTQINGPVCQDSCLEFFLCPCPEQSPAYFNFESNAIGTLYVGFSPEGTRASSAPLDPDVFREKIQVRTVLDKAEKCWSVTLRIPYALIRQKAPAFRGKEQTYVTGNFYKCGEHTNPPHFAVWNDINSNIITKPDFHVVKYFGMIEIK